MKDFFTITNAADGASKVDEEIETEADRQQRKFDECHGKNDDMVNMMMSQYMLAALMDFDKMDYEQVKEISRECAFTGMNGISVSGDKTYTLKAFPSKKFSGYGKLSHQPLEDLEAGARIMVGEVKKEPMDFALWKGSPVSSRCSGSAIAQLT